MMLSPNEFTVGSLSSARPLSLMLPRGKFEAAFLVGSIGDAPVAVCLNGVHSLRVLPLPNDYWNGLIVPDVRIEVDERSVYNPDDTEPAYGHVVRSQNALVLRAHPDSSRRVAVMVTLVGNLPLVTGEAAFAQWHLVIGHGSEKRAVWASHGRREPELDTA